MMATQEDTDLRKLIEPWLAAERLELDDLEFSGAGRGRTLRVVIDGEGPLDLDLISEVSEGLSRLLDNDQTIDGSYQLEVSSPGLERKLRVPRHFHKSTGREVKLKVRQGETTRSLGGKLEAADDEGFVVTTAEGSERFAYGEVLAAKTIFRWEKAPKPGKKESAP
jgi:ribosome maturation factor RimP